jgi:hypothetical protein
MMKMGAIAGQICPIRPAHLAALAKHDLARRWRSCAFTCRSSFKVLDELFRKLSAALGSAESFDVD